MCVPVHVYVYMCARECDQRLTLSTFLNCSLPYSLRQSSSLNLELINLVKLAGHKVLGILQSLLPWH